MVLNIQGLGTLAFAFGCHQHSLAFESLDEPTESRWSIVAAMSLIVSFIFALIFAATGYVSFGSQTQANVLNLETDSVIANVARMSCIEIMLLFSIDFSCTIYMLVSTKILLFLYTMNSDGGDANAGLIRVVDRFHI